MQPQEDRLIYTHDLVIEWVKFADTKASVLLAVQGGTATLILPNIIQHARELAQSWLVLGCLVLGLTSALIGFFWSIRAILPRLAVGAPSSHLYFAHIASLPGDARSVAKALKDRSDDNQAFLDDLSLQILFNSRVCIRKFKDVTFGTYGLIGSIAFSVIGSISYFVGQLH